MRGQISPAAGRGRSLQLCLMKGLPATIFTQINITAEDSSPLQVVVCDATIQNTKVTKGDGPSLKVQLCVLKADFESEDWTAEEFNSNIESPREGKGPLLKGDTVITMENGVGFFKNVEFTDNSCWTRSGKFRLGIKVLSSNSSPAADIKEARSERIRVKDKRGVANEKSNRPSLEDSWVILEIRDPYRLACLSMKQAFCFICSHLISGQKEGDELRRNSDVMEILKKTRFPRVHGSDNDKSPETILQHDRIIWLGDLNYRIALSYGSAKALVEMQNWRALLENDQLCCSRRLSFGVKFEVQ